MRIKKLRLIIQLSLESKDQKQKYQLQGIFDNVTVVSYQCFCQCNKILPFFTCEFKLDIFLFY